MSATEPHLPCRWHDCPSAGPFSNAQALFEHLINTHYPSVGTAIYCDWDGCKHKSPVLGETARRRHFCVHAGLKPYKCNETACVASFRSERELKEHARRRHRATGIRLSAPKPALGLSCRWAGCPREFTGDDAGAALLAAHLAAEHHASPSGCRWADCTRMPRSGLKNHLITHLPAWYKPFKCSICGETFQRLNIFKRHTNGAEKPNGCLTKLRDGTGSGGERELTAAADGDREAEMPPPFSPSSILSSPPTPPARSPRLQESSSPHSSHAPLPQPISPSRTPTMTPSSRAPRSSPRAKRRTPFPGEEDLDVSEIANYHAVDNHISIAALHARLCEMQAEIDTLRRAVQSLARTPEDDLHLL